MHIVFTSTVERYDRAKSFNDELPMGQRDRISIDVSDIRTQIEQCRGDVAWSELPLSAKIRVLVRERLAQIEEEKPSC